MIAVIAAAWAQDAEIQVPPVNAQNYRPPMDSSRTLWADDAGRILSKPAFKARLFAHYVHAPFVFYPDGEGSRTLLVSDALQLDALAMFHIDRFRIGLDVPIYLLTASQVTGDGAGLGDLALDGRATLLDRADDPIGLALGGRFTLPTTTVEAPLGYGGPGAELFAIVDEEIERWLIAFNLGFRFVPKNDLLNVALNDQAFARLGAGWQIVDDAGVSLDLNANLNVREPANVAGVPVEVLVGGWGRFADDFVLRGGVGTGLTPGIGSGDFRAVITLGYEPPEDLDPDLDGILGDLDACPDDPEDKDGFEDENGCPDLDNDQDGIVDVVDGCPLEPEDQDAFKDDDGCPDFTSQVTFKIKQQNGKPVPAAQGRVAGEGTDEGGGADFVVDLHDGPYTFAGQAPGYLPAELGFDVPLPDGKKTVVLVLQPDVIYSDITIRVQDPQGKPLPSPTWFLDGGQPPAPMVDGVVTVSLPIGTRSLDVRHEGYKSERRDITIAEGPNADVIVKLKPSQVVVTRERIDVKGTVYFDTAKATIQPRSFGLLDDVASVLLDHPELTKIRIEGHTDSRGGADYNRELSDKRAKSVMAYLVAKGIDAGRLEAIGYGEDKPVDPREVAEAWDKNRRVDFFIVERQDGPPPEE